MCNRPTGTGVPSRDGFRTSEHLAESRAIADLSSGRLLALTAKRDEQAFAELYDRYGRVAFALAYRVLRNRELAEDAVQEGFLDLWRSVARFRPEQGTPRTLLLTLVHRRAVDRVRWEERRRAEPLDERAELGPGGEELAASLERERVRAALRRLPDRCREAIELAYYDGFTQQEIASRLGVPLGTIKSRTARGLFELAELLREGENGREIAPAQRRLAGVAEA